MGVPIDLTGQRFGKLVASHVVERGGRRGYKWLCSCDCGQHSTVTTENLRSGNSKACGRCRVPSYGGLKHGHTASGVISSTYHSWTAMKARCTDATRENAKYYVEKGISYDPAWEDFTNFLVDMGERPAGKTLDRIKGNLGYSKSNCRWATPYEQTHNRSCSR